MVQTCYHRVFKNGVFKNGAHSGGEMAELGSQEGGEGRGGGGGGGAGGGRLGGGGSVDDRRCTIEGGLAPDAVMPSSAGESDEDYIARLQVKTVRYTSLIGCSVVLIGCLETEGTKVRFATRRVVFTFSVYSSRILSK
jgi:hypothetical protein